MANTEETAPVSIPCRCNLTLLETSFSLTCQVEEEAAPPSEPTPEPSPTYTRMKTLAFKGKR